MTPARRQSLASPPPDGDLGTYQKFRDRLLITAGVIILGLIGFVVQNHLAMDSRSQAEIERRLDNAEKDIARVRDGTATRFKEQGSTLSDHGERIKGIEATMTAQNNAILQRLDRIEAKMH